MNFLQEKTKNAQMKFLKSLDELSPGASKKIKLSLEKISKLKISNAKKYQLAQRELLPYQRLFGMAARKNSATLNQMKRFLNKIFPLIEFSEILTGVFESVLRTDPEIVDDIYYSPAYSGHLDYKVGTGTGVLTKSISVDETTGKVDGGYAGVYLGHSYVKGGVTEVFHVPAGTNRVKVSATINSDYTLFNLALVGVGSASASSFIQVFGDNKFKCEESAEMASIISVLANAQEVVGETTHTLTCSFTPDRLGGDYVLTGGLEGSAFGALNGMSAGLFDGVVEEMRVEFVEY